MLDTGIDIPEVVNLVFFKLAAISQYAVKAGVSQWVRFPPGSWSLQPVAIGAATEVTNSPKSSV
jgi:hypothetical protein